MALVRKLLGASTWLFADRLIRLGLSFVVGILVARHYGPQEFGQISFVVATAAIFGSLSSVGLDDIIPRDLALNENGITSDDILCTALTLRLAGGSLAYLLLMLLILWTEGISTLLWIALILGPYFLLQATDVYEYRLRVENKFSAIAKTKTASSVLATGLKIVVIWLSMPITALAAAMTSEFGFNAYIFSYLSKNINAWHRGRFNTQYAHHLLKRSWKIILAGMLAITQTRIEYFLIEHFLGWNSVGQYAAAFRVVELFDIVTVVFASILLPEFARKHIDRPEQTMRQGYLIGCITVLALTPLMLAAIYLFPLVYGAKFELAYQILPIFMLRPFFMMLISVRNMLLVIEHRLFYLPIYAGIGTLTSLGTGWFLIPAYGLFGAVTCSIVSLITSTLIADALINRKNLNYLLTCWREIIPTYQKLHKK